MVHIIVFFFKAVCTFALGFLPCISARCNMANLLAKSACAFACLIATATRICEQRVHCTGFHPRAFGRFHPAGVSTASAGTLRPINDRATNTSSHQSLGRRKQTPDVRKQRDLRGCCAAALLTRSLPEEAPFINPTQLVNAHVAAAGSCSHAGLLILRPRAKLDASRVPYDTIFCCWERYVSHTNTYPSLWPRHPARLSHAAFDTSYPR
jgi:hypothetical protein